MDSHPPTANLVRIVLEDLLRQGWVLLLATAVMVCAISVVYMSYESRRYTSQVEQLLQQRDKLDVEWRNLLLEEQSLSEHDRITEVASKQLDMKRPLPKDEVIIRIP